MNVSEPAVVFENVEKQYGALRPLRLRDLRIAGGSLTMLIGFDRPAAEMFVNLVTGATLPEKGHVRSLGQHTAGIANSEQWLTFVERFGIASDRIVLLEGMTVAQNLAISFDLSLEPVPPAVMERVVAAAGEVGIETAALEERVAAVPPLLRAQIYLARALAFDPAVLVLEHPTANLSPEDAMRYADIVRAANARRRLTTVGLLMDEKFARATGGRLLFWQPASGEVREKSLLRFW